METLTQDQPTLGGETLGVLESGEALAYPNQVDEETLKNLLADPAFYQDAHAHAHIDTPPEPIAKKGRQSKLNKACLGLYGTVGMVVFAIDNRDGITILSQTEARAAELAALAEHYPWLKTLIFQLTEKSDLVSFFAGHVALAGALMANHGTSFGQIWTQLSTPVRIRRAEQRAKRQEQPQGGTPQGYAVPAGTASEQVSTENAEQNGLGNVQGFYAEMEALKR